MRLKVIKKCRVNSPTRFVLFYLYNKNTHQGSALQLYKHNNEGEDNKENTVRLENGMSGFNQLS